MAFKRLKDFFFEEVEDDDEVEDEIDEEETEEFTDMGSKRGFSFFDRHAKVEEEELEQTKVFEPVKTSMSDITLETKEVKREKEEFIPKEDVAPLKFYDVASKPSTFIDIEDKTVEPKVEPIVQQAVPAKPTVNVVRREIPSKSVEIKDYRSANNYEYRTVISPIYGRTGKDAEIYETLDNTDTNKPQGSNGSYLGTVFSPMYGQKRSEEATSKKDEGKSTTVKVNVVDELPPLRDIDELIETPKRSKEDDVHQYSLFDDVSKNSQKSEEKVSEKDISEFFD